MKKIIIIILIFLNSVALSKDTFEIVTPKNNGIINSKTKINLNWNNKVTKNTSVSYYDYSKNTWNDLGTTDKTNLLLDIDKRFQDSVLFRIKTTLEGNIEIIPIKDKIEITTITSYENNIAFGSRELDEGIYYNNDFFEFHGPILKLKFIDNNRLLIGSGDGVYLLNIITRQISKFSKDSFQTRGIEIVGDTVLLGYANGEVGIYKISSSFIRNMKLIIADVDTNNQDIIYDIKFRNNLLIFSTYSGTVIVRNRDLTYNYHYHYSKLPNWTVDYLSDFLITGGNDDTVRIFNHQSNLLVNKIPMKGDIRCILKVTDSTFVISSLNDDYIYIYKINGDILCKFNVGLSSLGMTLIGNTIHGAGIYSNRFKVIPCTIIEDIVKVHIKEQKNIVFNSNDKILNNYRIIENYKDYQIYNMDGNEVYDIYNAGSGIYIMILNDKQLKWILKD